MRFGIADRRPSGQLALTIFVAFAVSGCVSTTEPGSVPGRVLDEVSLEPVVAVRGCQQGCWEPAVATDDAGRVFVVSAHEPLMAVSHDSGSTFEPIDVPPIPPGAPSQATQWDGTVATDATGRLYYYAFLAVPTGAPLPIPIGLQVAASSDAGSTWDANTFLSIANGMTEPVVSPWKSWLGFDAEGAVYLNYNSRGTGMWFARSDDGGGSFTSFRRVTEPTDRIISVFLGPPVVDDGGRLYMPYFGDQSPQDPGGNPFLPKGHALRVAVSDDRGESFRHAVVATAGPPDYVGAYFPVMTIDPSGRLWLAHWEPGGRIVVRASDDRAETWSGPFEWSHSTQTYAAPWAGVADGGLSVVYYAAGESGGSALHLSRGEASRVDDARPDEAWMFADGITGGGDFAHFAFLPGGRVVAVWPDPETGTIVARVAPDQAQPFR